MPRIFNELETRQIKMTLMTRGKELFSTIGIKKTTIDDLVNAAGIAKGTFYKFFPSKEILYLEILEDEERYIRSTMAEANLQGKDLSKENLKAFLSGIICYIDENPIFLKMFDENALELIMRKIPPERIQKHMENDSKWFSKLFSSWKQEGYLPGVDEDIISALFRSIFILFTQKEAIGKEVFKQSMELLFEYIAIGIIGSREEK